MPAWRLSVAAHSPGDRGWVRPTAIEALGTSAAAEEERVERAEEKDGIAPIPYVSVIYELENVIVVGGGADATSRRSSANGFIWTIDGSAPHAADWCRARSFTTGRAVGL